MIVSDILGFSWLIIIIVLIILNIIEDIRISKRIRRYKDFKK